MNYRYFWLSFCDASKPKGSQFLGVSIIRATDFVTATRLAWFLGCNPGGEVQGHELDHLPAGWETGKLYPPDEARRLAAWQP